MYEQVKIILINTTHPGNIGAVARAMKNMGFKNLCLVSPKLFPSPEAVARASDAADLLENATVVNTIEEALADCHWVMGLSARTRKISWPTLNVKTAVQHIATQLRGSEKLRFALVFGQEQSGLLNEELAKCHYQITIPANPEYASLNLAQAVQIVTYELRMAILENSGSEMLLENPLIEEVATSKDLESFYTHLRETLEEIQFLDPKNPGFLLTHLRKLYARARPTRVELNILRGILTQMQKKYSLIHD
jgi:tRNA (cytidine32/uridine32-2'-O)-methyltransferase